MDGADVLHDSIVLVDGGESRQCPVSGTGVLLINIRLQIVNLALQFGVLGFQGSDGLVDLVKSSLKIRLDGLQF